MENKIKILFTSKESNAVVATLTCSNNEFATRIINECNLSGIKNNFFTMTIAKE